jgi:beta-lactamase class D
MLSKLLAAALVTWLVVSASPEARADTPGCTVILDAGSGGTLHRQGICDRRFSPASTFKIVLSLIGYDAGFLKDEHAPSLDYRPGVKALKRDQKTVDPTIWMRDSILWYSREITQALGPERFAAYVSKLGYGNGDVSGDPGRNNGLTQAWLGSSLEVTADEQARFVQRFVNHDLPVSERAYAMTQAVMPRFEARDGWIVRGKTGTAWHRDEAGELDSSRAQGWFVGWAERNGERIVFARVEEGRGSASSPMGPRVRDALVKELPDLLKRKR